MLGAGFAGSFSREMRRDPPALVHGAWAGAPATAGWILWRMHGWPYSAGAHAYDLYEHGGDWWLREKLQHARFVHTSTEMGRRELVARGVPSEKIQVIRRGLDTFPAFKPLRQRSPPIAVGQHRPARPEEGFGSSAPHLRRAEARLASPSRHALLATARCANRWRVMAARLKLADAVKFTGQLAQPEVWAELGWADVLLHTGVVAPSGDRDGLPNVIPEAMAAGVLVVTSPVAATTEAISQERTGLVADVDLPLAWVVALRRLGEDDKLAETLRTAARRWVEENYDAHKNIGAAGRVLRESDEG